MILDYAKRPIEVFNPANRAHREHYANFLRNRTWGRCPVRFEIAGSDASNNNAAYAMQRMLTEYYIEQEFVNQTICIEADVEPLKLTA